MRANLQPESATVLRNAVFLCFGLAALVILTTWAVSYLHVGHASPYDHHPIAWAVLSIPINAASGLSSPKNSSATAKTVLRPRSSPCPARSAAGAPGASAAT